MTTSKNSVKSVSLKYRHIVMGHVILIWKMFNTPFLFILYKLQVMKRFLSSSKHYDIIPSGVILNPNILCECIASKNSFSHDNVCAFHLTGD